MLLIYALFLGIVLTLWFALSPGREPDAQETRRDRQDDPWADLQRERPTRAEERSRGAARVYADSNDGVRGANARPQANLNRVEDVGRETRTRNTGAEDANIEDTRTEDTNAKRPPARSPATTKKRERDAFEDFIRSKNDDFEF